MQGVFKYEKLNYSHRTHNISKNKKNNIQKNLNVFFLLLVFFIIFLKKKVGAGGKSGARDEKHECYFFGLIN